jgi:hypothetical protein
MGRFAGLLEAWRDADSSGSEHDAASASATSMELPLQFSDP